MKPFQDILIEVIVEQGLLYDEAVTKAEEVARLYNLAKSRHMSQCRSAKNSTPEFYSKMANKRWSKK